ncbi:integral membrane protein [Moniliophthora roreri]|nr:integral membrane protein [Moniliophthora roreri]
MTSIPDCIPKKTKERDDDSAPKPIETAPFSTIVHDAQDANGKCVLLESSIGRHGKANESRVRAEGVAIVAP